MQQLLDMMLATVKGVQDRLTARVEAIERREWPAAIVGRDGRDGAPGPVGPPGPAGPPGPPGATPDVVRLQEQIAAMASELKALREEVALLRAQPVAAPLPDVVLRRLDALETREPLVGPPGPAGKDGRDGVDGKDGAPGPAGKDGRDGVDGKDGAVGLAGKDGRDGRDGKDGRDGVDGVGFDDLEASFDHETKQLMLRAIRDGRIKEWAWFVPFLRYRGVFDATQTYLAGDQVTHAGSMWVATQTTTQTPQEFGEAKHWILSAKRGRDGKTGPQGPAGKDGKDGRPGRDLTQLGPDGSKW